AMRLSQPTETVRVPVSRRPIVCGVVGGTQALATSSSVIARARRTSRMRVIMIAPERYEPIWFCAVLQILRCGKRKATRPLQGAYMKRSAIQPPRLLREKPVPGDSPSRGGRPARSVTVNLTENPLGWLHARGHVTQRQFDAGEQLRMDWERGQLSQRVTMA